MSLLKTKKTVLIIKSLFKMNWRSVAFLVLVLDLEILYWLVLLFLSISEFSLNGTDEGLSLLALMLVLTTVIQFLMIFPCGVCAYNAFIKLNSEFSKKLKIIRLAKLIVILLCNVSSAVLSVV